MFDAIYSLKNSKLPHQQQVYQLLISIDANLSSKEPLSYFGAVLSLLQHSQEHAPALIYLLNCILPQISPSLLRAKFAFIMPLLPLSTDLEPLLTRSLISCISTLLLAHEPIQLSNQLELRKHFLALCQFTLDARPKVRKTALEALEPLLKSKALSVFLDFLLLNLKNDAALASNAINPMHFLFLIQSNASALATGLDRDSVLKLCQALLSSFKALASNSPLYLQAAFQLFVSIAEASPSLTLVDWITRAMIEMKPWHNDAQLIPAWFEALCGLFIRISSMLQSQLGQHTEYHHQVFPDLVSGFFIKSFSSVFVSEIKPEIQIKAAFMLKQIILNCITDDMAANADPSAPVILMIKTVANALSNIRFKDAWNHILLMTEAFFIRLGSVSTSKCVPLLLQCGLHRDDPTYASSYVYKEELERAIGAAAQTMGLDAFLTTLPLNIENEHPGEPRRPYLLANFARFMLAPLDTSAWVLTRSWGPTTLEFYYTHLFELSQRLFEKAEQCWIQEKELEAKLYETLGMQSFELFPIVCATRPKDVLSIQAMAPTLGHILQSLPMDLFPQLPSHPDFRPIVCDGLNKWILGLTQLKESAHLDSTRQLVQQGLQMMSKFSEAFMSTLCNVYTTVTPDMLESAQGQALQLLHERQNQYIEKTISAFLKVAEPKEVEAYFHRLVETLTAKQSQLPIDNNVEKLQMVAMMELALILLKGMNQSSQDFFKPYFNLLKTFLTIKDATLTKKTYKSWVALFDHVAFSFDTLKELGMTLLEPECVVLASTSSKKARMMLLQRLADSIPTANSSFLLEWIPLCIPEVMLATKESNEKARNAAYECLISLGQRMMCGDAADNAQFDLSALSKAIDEQGMDDDDTAMSHDAVQTFSKMGNVSIQEFFMMVVAGLAGASPHMQSAAIASISRLFYEFYEFLGDSLIHDLIETVTVFLKSKSREIIKAALGFVKVILSLCSTSMIEPFLQEWVVSILGHSRNEKSHFKSKIRHIFEKLVKKFPESVEAYVPEPDKKLLINIRKRRERLKKKKAAQSSTTAESEDDMGNQEPQEKTRSKKHKNFDKTMYGSDSESDSDLNNDQDCIPASLKDETRQKPNMAHSLLQEDQEVLDFLDPQLISKMSSAPLMSSKSKKRKQDSVEMDDEGRMIFNEEEELQETKESSGHENKLDYYKESLMGEGSFTRTPSGKIKFIDPQGKKRARTEEDEAEKTGKTGVDWRRKNPHRSKKGNTTTDGSMNRMLGRHYKSEKAGGDVKRSGMADPHAYIPLSGQIVGNKNKTAKVTGSFKNIIKAAQKGAQVKSNASKSKFKGLKKGNKKHHS